MKKFSVKMLVATAIGAALFFVLGRFVAIPSGIPDTNITIQFVGAEARGFSFKISILISPIGEEKGFMAGCHCISIPPNL